MTTHRLPRNTLRGSYDRQVWNKAKRSISTGHEVVAHRTPTGICVYEHRPGTERDRLLGVLDNEQLAREIRTASLDAWLERQRS